MQLFVTLLRLIVKINKSKASYKQGNRDTTKRH